VLVTSEADRQAASRPSRKQPGSGFRVPGSGFRVPGAGFPVPGSSRGTCQKFFSRCLLRRNPVPGSSSRAATGSADRAAEVKLSFPQLS
jgi:hypothetical protein